MTSRRNPVAATQDLPDSLLAAVAGKRRAAVVATLTVIAALGAGAAWGTCFGREPRVLLPWLGLAPLVAFLPHPRRVLLGFLHGLGAWLVSLYWIVPTLETYGGLSRWLSIPLCGLLAAYLGLFHGAFAWLGGIVWRRGWGLVLGSLPALWVALEWLRGTLLGGFPWNLAAYAWVDLPGALPLSAWVGSFGVSFVLVFANTGVALAAFHRRWELLGLGLLLPLLLLSFAARFSRPGAGDQGDLAVRVLQPNVSIVSFEDKTAIDRNYRKVLRLSRSACNEAGALVLWPESAAWPYVLETHDTLRRDLAGLAALGCPLLINSPSREGDKVFNSALLIDLDGRPVGRYDKLHLVPFGEYVPLRGVLPFVGTLARNAGNMSPGAEPELLSWAGEELGVSICYEVTYPRQVAKLVSAGASVLITLTNDAWYGDTSAPWQHFRAARFRAAENRRFLLRAAITGVSAVIRPDGTPQELLGVGEEGILAARVTGERRLTFYSRLPWLVPLLCFSWVAFAIFWATKGARS